MTQAHEVPITHLNFQGMSPLLFAQCGLRTSPGLTHVAGDEGTGKTTLLRWLSGDDGAMADGGRAVDAIFLNLALPEHGEHTPEEVWASLRTQWPLWDMQTQINLTQDLGLQEHLGKKLFMLSTGSRRKVALVGLLASGAQTICIDQPYVALDMVSAQVVRVFLNSMADHPSRAWVVADYEPDPQLAWGHLIQLA